MSPFALALAVALAAAPPPQKITVKAMWEYQQELGLSDQQVAALRSTYRDATEYPAARVRELASNDARVAQLLRPAGKVTMTRNLAMIKAAKELTRRNEAQLKALAATSDPDPERMRELWRQDFQAAVDIQLDQLARATPEIAPGVLAQVRTLMSRNVQLSVDMRVHDVVASRRLLDTLTPAQRKKWSAIRAHASK